MATLKITNGNTNNPLTVDLSQYLDVQEGSGLDFASPQFTSKIWSRSLLKEGATLSLEQLHEKELVIPLNFGPVGGLGSAPVNTSSLMTLIQQVNQVIESPGFTVSWQPTGASQPTIFDGLSGQIDVDYSYRKEEAHWTHAKLRLFTQPLGRAASPRRYATASGYGPLLMITPYASGGGQIIGQSTQAGVAGWGAGGAGGVPSGGLFYWGSPSLAGDAPAMLEISYVGPLPNTATNTGVVPWTVVSVLPDQNYVPIVRSNAISFLNLDGTTAVRTSADSGAYVQLGISASSTGLVQDVYSFSPLSGPSDLALEPTAFWAGPHRLLAVARASCANTLMLGGLQLQQGPLVQNTEMTFVNWNLDWGLYDLGTFTLRPSEYPVAPLQIRAQMVAGGSAALDLLGLAMFPDNSTWFLNPTQINPGQYGYPPSLASAWGVAVGAWSNTLLIDDYLGDQFIYSGMSQTVAPSPIGSVPSASRITQFSRGLIPRPDPKNGPPVIAIFGMGQAFDQPLSGVATLINSSLGPAYPGTAADNSGNGGAVAWAATGNVKALDGIYASAALTSGQSSHWLEATNFGFAIPATATITGIQVQVVRHGSTGGGAGIIDQAVRMIAGGVVQAESNRALPGVWPTTDATASYGSPTDLWAGIWPVANINATNFGVALAVTANTTATAFVDAITVTVYYTLGSSSQFYSASQSVQIGLLPSYAQVNVLERCRYVLP